MIKFDHVCCAVRQAKDAFNFIKSAGGLKHKGGTSPGLSGCQYVWPNGSKLELLQPSTSDPDHFVNKFLKKRGPGLHHITFIVPSLADSVQKSESLGFKMVGYSDEKPWWKEAFFHPKQSLNTIVQIVESDDSCKSENAWSIDWPEFTAFDAIEDTVAIDEKFESIDGPKFRIHSSKLHNAKALLGDALGGSLIAVPGFDMCYTWEGSPMKVYIQVSDSVTEAKSGPIGIMYSALPGFKYPPMFVEETTKTLFIPNKKT